MNTTYKPIDPEFLHMLAGAKARGLSWTRLAEMTKIPVGELEVIPWREPKEWAKASKYAEKLVAHEVLAEMVSSLRFQMNDPVNNGRLKSQVANSLVRVVQLQHALRAPKKSLVKHGPPRPTPEPLPTANSATAAPRTSEPVTVPTSVIIPKPTANKTLGSVAVVLLFVLLGAFGWGHSAVGLVKGEGSRLAPDAVATGGILDPISTGRTEASAHRDEQEADVAAFPKLIVTATTEGEVKARPTDEAVVATRPLPTVLTWRIAEEGVNAMPRSSPNCYSD